MFDVFQYGFVIRGFEAGIIMALIAPLIGIFLVLRRYSFIADTLAHVSLAGVAAGLLLGLNPFLTAIATAVFSSVVIEKIRITGRVLGESALSILLSGSLALAVILISLSHAGANLYNYLFGSVTTLRQTDVYIIGILAVFVVTLVALFYKELVFVTVDEEAAKVSGIPTGFINILLIILAALTVSLAIPTVGVLLIGALIVIPVVSALQLRLNFKSTIIAAEIFSVFSVTFGIIISYYADLSAGGTIVLVNIAILCLALLKQKYLPF